MFADTIAAVGKPDIAINTVGKVLKKPMAEISEAEYDEMSAVNAKAAFFSSRKPANKSMTMARSVRSLPPLLGAYTPFYSSYAGTKAPVEHFTRAASKEFGERGISVTAIGLARWIRRFSTRLKAPTRVAYHKTAAALSNFSKTGLTDIGDIVPRVRLLVSEGWWMTGQTILVNGGYTTK